MAVIGLKKKQNQDEIEEQIIKRNCGLRSEFLQRDKTIRFFHLKKQFSGGKKGRHLHKDNLKLIFYFVKNLHMA